MKIGVSVGNAGPDATGMAERAAIAEQAGFDTLWVADHIVNPLDIESRYPYRTDGGVPWSSDQAWFDAIVSMSYCAAVTTRIEIASGVLIIAMREPLGLASQLATLDVLSKGRVTLGVGAGWLAEEFAAIGVDFATRGARTDEYIELVRALWSGPVGPYKGRFIEIPETVRCEPLPAHRIDILIGGTTPAALRRAGAHGDGWYGLFAEPVAPHELERMLQVLHEEATNKDRDPAELRVIVSIARASAKGRAELVSAYAELGVTEIVMRADLSDLDAARADLEIARELTAGLTERDQR